MNVIEKMHEVRFPIIYILSYIIYHILPLTIITFLTIKGVRSEQAYIFPMHYGDIKD